MPAAGGFIDTPNQRLAVTHQAAVEHGRRTSRAVPVAHPRRLCRSRLGDVAEVVEGYPPPIGDAVINDGPGLLLIVEKQLGANTLSVTRAVEAAIETLRPGLKDVEIDTTIFRPATFIEMSLSNLNRALLLGCVLVIVVLALFLMDWRTAFISITAIPLSLLAAALVLHYRGGTLNTMVLAGLVIALGEVVDDAIIDVENIVRRLRLNRHGRRSATGVRRGAGRLARSPQRRRLRQSHRRAGVHPGVLPGGPGRRLLPAAGASATCWPSARRLLVALLVTPALCLMLLARAPLAERDTRFLARLKGRYRAWLPGLLDRPSQAAAALIVLFVATLAPARRCSARSSCRSSRNTTS